jgi:two-component system chemotaxis response regulator CheY
MMAAILTVDDSPSVRQMVKLVLSSAGHDVTEAGNGAEGLEKAKGARFDLVLTDLNMPVMNGMAMIRGLRQMPALMGTPIVFLTTESDDAVKLEAKAAGATGWITKPFNAEQLHAVVAKLVRT